MRALPQRRCPRTKSPRHWPITLELASVPKQGGSTEATLSRAEQSTLTLGDDIEILSRRQSSL